MKYITLNLKIIPNKETDVDRIADMIKDSMTNMPMGNLLGKNGEYLGKIIFDKASVWPKPCLSAES